MSDGSDGQGRANQPSCHHDSPHSKNCKHLQRTDLGYGFFLTSVFEHYGVTLQKEVGAQFIDEIGSNTLMGCGYTLLEGCASEQGTKTPRPPVPGSSSLKLEAALEENSQLRAELTAVKTALDEEKALNAKRYMALLSSLTAKLYPPAP